jgi:probable O-glycosylation ligase (exosortase A-associated)
MRGALVLFIVLGGIPYYLRQPWIGILMFSWISYMNPHRYAWGFVRNFPVAMVVAVATFAGLMTTRDKNPLTKSPVTVVLLAFMVLFTFTTIVAINPGPAWLQWQKVMKILIMTFVTMILINSAMKLRYLLLVIAFSVGLIGLKGAIWVVKTGGAERVYGPVGSFLSDNNDLALALNMALPLLLYLAKDDYWPKWIRIGLRLCFVGSVMATVFTYSRGGFLTLSFVGFLLLLKARYKALAGMSLALGILVLALVVPSKWTDRMESIENYEQDNSARGRLNAWMAAWNLAVARPLTGGGFETWVPSVFAAYAPDPRNVRDVHSSYFEMLGEQGFIGLGLFLYLIVHCFLTIRMLKWRAKRDPNLAWARHYPDMLEVSIGAYLVGGAFLGRAYFDLFYHIVVAIDILTALARQKVSSEVGAEPEVAEYELSPAARQLKVAPR